MAFTVTGSPVIGSSEATGLPKLVLKIRQNEHNYYSQEQHPEIVTVITTSLSFATTCAADTESLWLYSSTALKFSCANMVRGFMQLYTTNHVYLTLT